MSMKFPFEYRAKLIQTGDLAEEVSDRMFL